MKKILVLSFAMALSLMSLAKPSNDYTLWYDEPAEKWVEAMPLGNGRLGAMVYGNPLHEEIQLNEETIWAGGPNNNVNPNAKEALPEIRELIFEGKYREAHVLCDSNVQSKKNHGMPYQVLGSLWLDFPGHERYTNYYRDLNMENAVATVKYRVGDVDYKREIITSFADQVVAIRLTASKKGKLNFSTYINTPQNSTIETFNDAIILNGASGGHENMEGGQLKFTTIARIYPDDGTLTKNDTALMLSNATAATILVSTGTNFNNYKDLSGDAAERAKNYKEAAEKKTFKKMLEDHTKVYKSYYDRVKFDLGRTSQADKTTDVRVVEYAESNDPQLVAMYFQFGRYLLIASSMPGTQPAPLQGIWNYQMKPSWDGKYTLNINAEMNYWPAELTNLSELHEPFLGLIKDLSETGQEAASTMYGSRGWTAHHNTDIWRVSGAIDRATSGMWPTASAWLCQHLWDRYLYNGSKEYLKSVYPQMKSASQFYLDFLVPEPVHGWMVVVPSNSPENAPKVLNPRSNVFAGCTMDNQMVFDLFFNTARAAAIVEDDPKFIEELNTMRTKLAPMQIGQHGQLQEWMFDWDDPKDDHRHVSHLWGVYPGYQISPYRTPLLLQAAKQSLIYRGDVSTGWSMGWKVNLWARFLDGNHAAKLLRDQLRPVRQISARKQSGGTYPNLFDAHPPFQIDGNFGCTAGIAEMLMQSHDGAVHLLPALPEEWANGKISGLRARGGFLLDFEWRNGKLYEVKVKSTVGGNCRLRLHSKIEPKGKIQWTKAAGENTNSLFPIQKVAEPLVSPKAVMEELDIKSYEEYDFPTEAGKMYVFKASK